MHMLTHIPLYSLALVVVLASSAGSRGAEVTPQQLLAAGQLEVEAGMTTGGALVPGRKLTLGITLATDRWFSGGTRISLPEVPGLVIVQSEQFAANASERRGDQDWVLQRWALDVYPQREGEFTIPPLALRVKVNAGDAGDVEGALSSPPVSFTVTLPAALAAVTQWVAAPEFSVSQRFDRSLEGLQVGDAFEREIVFEASDVLAMMLPTYTAQGLPGLAAYPAPPVLDQSSNRGLSRASRTERISYVVQAQGQYQLPAADFFWWDTSRDELQVLSLPATTISVGSGAATVVGTAHGNAAPVAAGGGDSRPAGGAVLAGPALSAGVAAGAAGSCARNTLAANPASCANRRCRSDSTPVVALGNKRHPRHRHRHHGAAHVDTQGGTRFSQRSLDISHGDGPAHAGAEAGRADGTDPSPLLVQHRLALPHRSLTLHCQAHPAQRRPRGHALENHLRPGKASRALTVGPPRPGDRPGEAGLHRVDVRRQLVAVQA